MAGSDNVEVVEYLRQRRAKLRSELNLVEQFLAEAEQVQQADGGSEAPAAPSTNGTHPSTPATADVGRAPARATQHAGSTRRRSGSTSRSRSSSGSRTPNRYGRPVRAMVSDILKSGDRWFSSTEVHDLVLAEVGERADDNLKNNVRAAFYTLKKEEKADNDNDGNYRWRQPSLMTTDTTLGSSPRAASAATEPTAEGGDET